MKCFADLGQGKGCIALTAKRCDNCSFFKTKEQVEMEEKRTKERLRGTPYETKL